MASKLALIIGIVFLLIGVIGLVGGLGIVGPSGIFATDLVHDLIHLVIGLVLVLVATRSPGSSSTALIVLGVIYLLVTLLGFISSGDDMVVGILMNNADDYLNLVLGVVILVSGLATRPSAYRI